MDYCQQEISRFSKELLSLYSVYAHDDALKLIVDEVIKSAAQTAYDAGMGGYHDDRGASVRIQELKSFLQGVSYGMTKDRENLGKYRELYNMITRESDPEYKEFLRLKEKFGGE